jgi:hypothetical protein
MCEYKRTGEKLYEKHKLLYSVWSTMKMRCYNPKRDRYKNYGGRGIIVCDEWLHNPKAFIQWALNNGYKQDLQIDRIDNDGNYEPSNCRFVTQTVNMRNRSNAVKVCFDGKILSILEISNITGISRYTLYWWRNKLGEKQMVTKIYKRSADAS